LTTLNLLFKLYVNLMIHESISNSIIITEKARISQDSIILSIGDPHFATDVKVIDGGIDLLNNGTTNYSDSQGLKELREAIITGYGYKDYDYQNILITPGSKQGLFYILKTLDQGATVLLIEPYWHSYLSLVKDLNLSYQFLNSYEKDFLAKMKSIKFDALIVCNPNNPDGHILKKSQMDEIYNIIITKDAILIADEIYSNYDYNLSFTSFSDYNSDRILILNGFSKRFAMTGWRLGFILCNDYSRVKNLTRLNQLYATCVANISQYCGIAAMNSNFDNFLSEYYRGNRDLVLDYFPTITNRLNGGLYAFINLVDYGVTLTGDEFSELLFEKNKIAIVPGSVYGSSFISYFRLSFSIDRKILTEALDKIKLFIESIR
jgi:aspartate/methionine/tyrosine aminotransferase